MQRKYGRQICCICMSILFLIGIFSQANHVKYRPFTAKSEGAAMDAQGMTSYLSAETVTGMDDFHITENSGRTASGAFSGVRGVAVWMAALILLWFFGSVPPKRRVCFREKRMFAFRIITFIHQTDGKKKSCFDIVNWIKTGGLKWKSEQSIKYCL